jgi:tRNA pseudouridine55 synthase
MKGRKAPGTAGGWSKPGEGLTGVLVVDKPAGPTSHDVVARVRRTLRTREVGHAGTLDPMATGVLVVAVGEATKLVPWLTTERKRYVTTVALGAETDTLDAQGRVLSTVEPGSDLRAALAAADPSPLLVNAVDLERQRTSQVPPSFSAIHAGGERAYAKARRGEDVVLEPREVTVHEIAIVSTSADPPSVTLALEVSKGYYVRSLGRDLARALGTVGHLSSLRRTRSGSFDIAEAIALDAPELFESRLLALPVAAARVLPAARLTEAGVAHARCGRPVPASELEGMTPGTTAWFSPEGTLVAIGDLDAEGQGRVLRGFNPVS